MNGPYVPTIVCQVLGHVRRHLNGVHRTATVQRLLAALSGIESVLRHTWWCEQRAIHGYIPRTNVSLNHGFGPKQGITRTELHCRNLQQSFLHTRHMWRDVEVDLTDAEPLDKLRSLTLQVEMKQDNQILGETARQESSSLAISPCRFGCNSGRLLERM